MSTKIPKPWGYEILITEPNLPYNIKIAHTQAGHRWSLQYHDQKIETITLISGQGQIIFGDSEESLTTLNMEPQVGYTIKPNTIHRFQAITDCITYEASTPETGTTFRLQDDYQRGDESEEIRKSPNRGWQQN